MKKNEKKLKNCFERATLSKKSVILSNSRALCGLHTCGLTKRAAVDKIEANRLVAFEKGGTRVKLCGSGDIPFGVSNNDAERENDLIGVSLLCNNSSTARIVSAGAISAGEYVCAEDNGCISAFKSDSKKLIVGIALSPCDKAGCYCEIMTSMPR